MNHQPIPELLHQQLTRLGEKRAAFARMAAPAVESLCDRLRVAFTYASNALEGNTLSLQETQLIAKGLAPGQDKTLREVNEAIHHFAALKQVEQWAAEGRGISASRLLGLHRIVVRGAESPGDERLLRNPVVTPHRPEIAAQIAEKLTALIDWTGHDTLHPVLLAAVTHLRFESLRPFLDENRRTGRLFLNWQLLRAGFPLTVIQVEERARYLDALEQGHAGNLLPLQILLAAAVERSLDLTCST